MAAQFAASQEGLSSVSKYQPSTKGHVVAYLDDPHFATS
jgi:hypothetical protein